MADFKGLLVELVLLFLSIILAVVFVPLCIDQLTSVNTTITYEDGTQESYPWATKVGIILLMVLLFAIPAGLAVKIVMDIFK